MNWHCEYCSYASHTNNIYIRETPWSIIKKLSNDRWVKRNADIRQSHLELAILCELSKKFSCHVPRVTGSCMKCGAIELENINFVDSQIDGKEAATLCAKMCKLIAYSNVEAALPNVTPGFLLQKLATFKNRHSNISPKQYKQISLITKKLTAIYKMSRSTSWESKVIHGDFHQGNVGVSIDGYIVILDWADCAKISLPVGPQSSSALISSLLVKTKSLIDLISTTAKLERGENQELLTRQDRAIFVVSREWLNLRLPPSASKFRDETISSGLI